MRTAESRAKSSASATLRWATDPRRAPERVCDACGITYRPTSGTRSARGSRFCTRACYHAGGVRGEQHHKWSATGRHVHGKPGGQQYVWIRDGKKWRMEHVVIAERVLGRALKKGEVVHHINGNGSDNRNSNLLICTQSYHAALHQRMAQAWMREHFSEGQVQ